MVVQVPPIIVQVVLLGEQGVQAIQHTLEVKVEMVVLVQAVAVEEKVEVTPLQVVRVAMVVVGQLEAEVEQGRKEEMVELVVAVLQVLVVLVQFLEAAVVVLCVPPRVLLMVVQELKEE